LRDTNYKERELVLKFNIFTFEKQEHPELCIGIKINKD